MKVGAFRTTRAGWQSIAGWLALLQQAYQVSNWSTGLLMRRRVSLALHARLINNRGACAGACVYVYVVLMEMMLVVSLDNGSICSPRCPRPPQVPPMLTAQSRGISSHHLTAPTLHHPARPASASSLKHAFALSVAETCPTNTRSIAVS